MNRNNIESTAASAVRIQLAQVDCLNVSYISEGDREPSWDGRVLLTDRQDKTIKLINTQVKGISARSLDELECKELEYSKVSVKDLRNYLQNGGVIYFVVTIFGSKQAVFYNELLPVKIQIQLENIPKKQKTTTFPFKKLPTDAIAIEEIFVNFADESKRQASFSGMPLVQITEVFTEDVFFYFTGIGKNPIQAMLHMIGKETYTYINRKGFPIPVPTNEVGTIVEISRRVDQPVTVNEVEFYSGFRIEFYEGEAKVFIGKSIEFVSTNDPFVQGSMNITLRGSLNEKLHDVEFLQAIIKAEGFSFGSYKWSLPGISDEFTSDKTLFASFDFLTNLRKLLDYFGIRDDVEFDSIDDKEIQHIYWLIDGVLKGQVVGGPEKEESVSIIRSHILKYPIILFGKQVSKAKYEIKNFCREKFVCIYADDKTGVKYQVSQYCIFEVDEYINLRSIDFEDVVDSIITIERTEASCHQANDMALKMLAAFDISGNGLCLDAAKRVFSWLSEDETYLDKNISLLNRMQCAKRTRELESKEIDLLLEVIECDESNTPENRAASVGAYILLNDFSKASEVYNFLSVNSRKSIDEYPIKNLWISP